MKVLHSILYLGFVISGISILDGVIPKRKISVSVEEVWTETRRSAKHGQNDAYTGIRFTNGDVIPISLDAFFSFKKEEQVVLVQSRLLGQYMYVKNEETGVREWCTRGLYSWWGVVPLLVLGLSGLGYLHRRNMFKLANIIWLNFLLIPINIWLVLYNYILN